MGVGEILAMMVDYFQTRVDQQYKHCLDYFPSGNITAVLKEKLWHLCIETNLAHTNAKDITTQVAVNMNTDLWSALGEMTDTLKTTKPDLALLNCGQVSKEVLKALEHVSPLGGSVDCLEPHHLNPWWAKVEAAL